MIDRQTEKKSAENSTLFLCLSLSKNYPNALASGKIGSGGVVMDEWKKDARRDVVFVDIDALVPQDHLPRKIERVWNGVNGRTVSTDSEERI